MPCYTKRRTTIDVSKMNSKLLEKALVGMGFQIHRCAGWTGGITWADVFKSGKLTVVGLNPDSGIEDRIRVAYAKETVKAAAARFGWQVQVQQQSNPAVAAQYLAVKR